MANSASNAADFQCQPLTVKWSKWSMFLVLRFGLTSPIFQLFIGIPRGSPDRLNRQKSVESVEAIILPLSCYFPCLPLIFASPKNLDRPFKKTQLMQNPWLKLSVTDLLNGETIVKKPHVCFQKFGLHLSMCSDRRWRQWRPWRRRSSCPKAPWPQNWPRQLSSRSLTSPRPGFWMFLGDFYGWEKVGVRWSHQIYGKNMGETIVVHSSL